MAATKIPDSDSYSQGLIKYLEDASQLSRDNIFLRELGSAANCEHQLHVLLQEWILAKARSMLVRWIEAYKGPRRQPSNAREVRKLPARPTRPETERSALGCFFGDREKAKTIRGSQTVTEQRRWSIYFEAWGCLICERKDIQHAGNGMCHNCRMRTYHRLKVLTDRP